MTPWKLAPVVIALAVVPSTAQAAANCDFTVNAVQSGSQVYDPAALTGSLVQLTFSTTTTGVPTSCSNVPVSIKSADGGTFKFDFAGQQLAYTLVNSNRVEGPTSTEIDLNGNAKKDILNGFPVTVDLFNATPGQFVQAGSYDAHLLVTAGSNPPIPVVAHLVVEPGFRFVPENGSTTKSMSFGEVTNGAERSDTIYYQTNAALQIRATSMNDGVLIHELGPALGTIDYTATYNGTVLNLSSGPVVVARGYEGMATQMDTFRVTIAPQSGKYAGKYRDTVTLEFIPY
jgi:hypothetical protein